MWRAANRVVIIGRSGGGKSVLLKHLIGLLSPDEGEVLIDGENLCGLNERELLRVRQKFGMLFQGAALFDSMTVAENVAFALRRLRHGTDAEIEKKVAEALDMVGTLRHRMEKSLGTFRRHAQTGRPRARHYL